MKKKYFNQKIKEHNIASISSLIGVRIADITLSNSILYLQSSSLNTKEINIQFLDSDVGFLIIKSAMLEGADNLLLPLNDITGIHLNPIESKYPGFDPMYLLPNFGNRIHMNNEFIIKKIEIYGSIFNQTGRSENLFIEYDKLIIFYSVNEQMICFSSNGDGIFVCFSDYEIKNMISHTFPFPFVTQEIHLSMTHLID